MEKKKILISVKTYPTISTKYDELVCTAGFDENGNWIRIFPIPFRKLDYINRYKKYEWIEMHLTKNKSDFRPESFRPVNIDDENVIKYCGEIGTKDNWAERKKIALKKVYTNISTLIEEAKNKEVCTSLATFRPTEIINFVYKEVENRDWSNSQIAALQQGNLFQSSNEFEVVKKLPFKFSYIFKDSEGRECKLMNEDWELGALYWRGIKEFNGDEKKACEYVKSKYWDEFLSEKDLYFFLGTTLRHHFTAPNPFVIIGTFYPKKEKPKPQLSFDF